MVLGLGPLLPVLPQVIFTLSKKLARLPLSGFLSPLPAYISSKEQRPLLILSLSFVVQGDRILLKLLWEKTLLWDFYILMYNPLH